MLIPSLAAAAGAVGLYLAWRRLRRPVAAPPPAPTPLAEAAGEDEGLFTARVHAAEAPVDSPLDAVPCVHWRLVVLVEEPGAPAPTVLLARQEDVPVSVSDGARRVCLPADTALVCIADPPRRAVAPDALPAAVRALLDAEGSWERARVAPRLLGAEAVIAEGAAVVLNARLRAQDGDWLAEPPAGGGPVALADGPEAFLRAGRR